MPTREEMVAFIQSKMNQERAPAPSREEMIKFVQSKLGAEKPKESKVETGIMQGIQGAMAGFLDEASGGVEAAGRVVGLKGLGGSFSDIGLSKEGPTLDMDVIKEAYELARNKKREILKKQSEDHPGLSVTANIIGGIASPANKIAKGMSLAKGGAAIGGINAAGYSDADNVKDLAVDTAKGAVIGAALGKGIDKASVKIGDKFRGAVEAISPAKKKMNEAEIRAAAKALDIEITPAMLDDSGFVERLEGSLSKSPSFFGQAIRRRQDQVTEKLREATGKATSEASNLTPYQLGEKFKSSLTSKVGERLDPITSAFDEVLESTKHIPVRKKSVEAIQKNIEKLPSYRLSGGSGKSGEYVKMMGKIENADDVKQVMTLLNADIRSAQGAEKMVLIQMKDKLATLEKNSIMRSAIESARTKGQGDKIGKEIVGQLKEARSKYRGLAEDLNEVSEAARVKMRSGPSAFLDDLESIPSERISDKFMSLENNRQMQAIAQKFPEEYQMLKSGRIKEIADAMIDNSMSGQGKVSTQKFLNEVRKLTPEAKSALFGGNLDLIKNIETVQRSLPRNFNPSGTASEQGWSDAIYRNVKDIPTYALYRTASTNLAKDIAGTLLKSPRMRDVYEKNPAIFQNIVSQIESRSGMLEQMAPKKIPISASDSESIAKGPDRWTKDGLKNVELHTGEAGSVLMGVDLKNPKVKRLLIAASDLKPGSKAMDRLIEQIKKEGGN